MNNPTTLSPDSAELQTEFLIILCDYSDDLAALKKRDGKLPAQAAVARLETILAQQRQTLLQQLEQVVPEKQDTVAIAKQYGSGSPQDALALGKNITIAKVHKILIRAKEGTL